VAIPGGQPYPGWYLVGRRVRDVAGGLPCPWERR